MSRDRGVVLAAQLTAAGARAFTEPGRAAANLPCLLIGPPRLAFDRYSGATATWSIVALAADTTGSEAWQQLEALLEVVVDELPVEVAEPVGYALTADAPTLPAYRITYTESID